MNPDRQKSAAPTLKEWLLAEQPRADIPVPPVAFGADVRRLRPRKFNPEVLNSLSHARSSCVRPASSRIAQLSTEAAETTR